jgi:membrane associated rhomboid family serine protease
MFPIRDDVPTNSVPWVNYLIIGLCVAAYLAQISAPGGLEGSVFEYGMVPARVSGELPADKTVLIEAPGPRGDVTHIEAPPPAIVPWLTILTSMFMHGGLMHIVGNMWFLYIFGDNVEDRYGHVGYALMYVLSGVVASLLHFATDPASVIPTVGASGAIAGVMGAYFLLYRHARVMTLIPLGVFTQLVAVPAPFFLGLWFVMQLLSAAGSQSGAAGVAFWAHVGGFVAGLGATWLLGFKREEVHPEVYSRHTPTPAWQRRRYPW